MFEVTGTQFLQVCNILKLSPFDKKNLKLPYKTVV